MYSTLKKFVDITKKVDIYRVSQKMSLLSGFEFLTLGRVFSMVKNNSKNFGN